MEILRHRSWNNLAINIDSIATGAKIYSKKVSDGIDFYLATRSSTNRDGRVASGTRDQSNSLTVNTSRIEESEGCQSDIKAKVGRLHRALNCTVVLAG